MWPNPQDYIFCEVKGTFQLKITLEYPNIVNWKHIAEIIQTNHPLATCVQETFWYHNMDR